MQASTGAAKKAGKEMTKQEKLQAREKAQMEKAAGKDGKKRARDESKSGKAKPKDGPAAKKCDLVPSSRISQALPAAISICAELSGGIAVCQSWHPEWHVRAHQRAKEKGHQACLEAEGCHVLSNSNGGSPLEM